MFNEPSGVIFVQFALQQPHPSFCHFKLFTWIIMNMELVHFKANFCSSLFGGVFDVRILKQGSYSAWIIYFYTAPQNSLLGFSVLEFDNEPEQKAGFVGFKDPCWTTPHPSLHCSLFVFHTNFGVPSFQILRPIIKCPISNWATLSLVPLHSSVSQV